MTDADGPQGATRCGFIALIGAPNAGKSTLLNALVGAKVAIVSPKPQTTRMRVLGLAIEGKSQLIYVDTPGIFAPRRRLDRAMVSAAWTGAGDADIVALLIDASPERASCDSRNIIARLAETRRPAMLILNKIDLTDRPRLLTIAADLNTGFSFTDTFMVSAKTGDGLEDLRNALLPAYPPAPGSTRRISSPISRQGCWPRRSRGSSCICSWVRNCPIPARSNTRNGRSARMAAPLSTKSFW
jgi:GTP-binding protein Era